MKRMGKVLSVLLSLALIAMLIPAVVQAATSTTVTVKKTDADGKPLAGAVFALTGTGNSVGTGYQATSNEDGIAEFVDVADGTYDLTESMAPKGYLPSSEMYAIIVNDGAVYLPAEPATDAGAGAEFRPYETITFVNEKLPTYAVTVKKTDEDGKPLAGAVFTLTGVGNFIGQNYEATSDKDGNATFQAWQGYYTLAEKTAPEGYIPSNMTYELSVSNDGVYLLDRSGDEVDFQPFDVTYVNEKLPTYAVTVKKTDADGKPLAGAVFTLTGTGNSIGRNYEAISGQDGMATFDVREGYYTLAEKTAPEGYTKSDKTYDIAVWGDKVHFVTETGTNTEYSDYETVTYINRKVETPPAPSIPKTGNSRPLFWWLALVLASGSAMIGTAVVSARKAR